MSGSKRLSDWDDAAASLGITGNVRDEFEIRSVGAGTHRTLRQPTKR